MLHELLFEKVKKLPINPYVVNWMISFLGNRRQRVVADGIVTECLNINRGVPQGTVIGPILFSIMVDDSKNELVKFADDLTLGVPGTESRETSGGSSVSQNKLPELILGYIYLQSNFIG